MKDEIILSLADQDMISRIINNWMWDDDSCVPGHKARAISDAPTMLEKLELIHLIKNECL